MEVTALAGLLRPLIDHSQPEWKKNQAALARRFGDETSRAFAEEHVYASNWSSEIHGIQIATSGDESASVDLALRSIPRRVGIAGEDLNELDVLCARGHVAVLGDPGAGKTTTLRRLVDHVAHLPGAQGEDDFKCVIVVVCREVKWKDEGLYDVLGRKTGIAGRLAGELDNLRSRIRAALDLGALLVIDGLDEVPRRYRADLERDLTDLGRYLGRSKVVVSCRSGDYVVPLAGFDEAEIQPLNDDQIRRVVDLILGPDDARTFYDAIHSPGSTAWQLADRPLFLIQMLQIFQRRGAIPDRPTYLYQSLTRLIVQDWDEQRRVRRTSKYDEFGVDDKQRFLADLAYELITRDLLRFDEADLADAYAQLADRYGLPRSEARKVARELEAHTGLLVQSGESFEFSHLSLQEFLAAESMVRGTEDAHTQWWSAYPEVAAVATALAQDANSWLAQLARQIPPGLTSTNPISSFLRRLGQERPRFVRSAALGGDLIGILYRARIQDPESVRGLGTMRPIRGSIADALSSFDSISRKATETRLARYDGRSQAAREVAVVATPVLAALLSADEFDRIVREAQGGDAQVATT
jgi:hypothetical protein